MTTELLKRTKQEVKKSTSENLRDAAKSYSPDTNVYDYGDEMVFVIDLPGVAEGHVALEIDENNTLIIRGENGWKEPDGAVNRQFTVRDYYRAFSMGSDLDKEKVSAKLENGVLEIRIPREEKSKPKRIQISA